jgi:hypothetical protein
MRSHAALALILGLAISVVTGCVTGNQAAVGAGFLADYTELVRGRGSQAQWVYFQAGADFSAYDAIIVDPVVVWDAEIAGPSVDPADPVRAQASYFERALREQLAHVYALVEAPRARTLRLRMAIVEGAESQVNIECELIDAVSHQRLVAAVDLRELSTSMGSAAAAADAMSLYDRWAEIIRDRLGALRDFDASQQERDAAAAD